MRYRLMATYRGVPYEVGVGPSNADVVLFAACPPPEELGFEPATGHWRKPVIRAEIDALWESRPVGVFRGEPCVVLDDPGERLHIAYLGTDADRATNLGYWQVDRGVFELLTQREEVTELNEERVDRPLRWGEQADGTGPMASYPYGAAPWPIAVSAIPAPQPPLDAASPAETAPLASVSSADAPLASASASAAPLAGGQVTGAQMTGAQMTDAPAADAPLADTPLADAQAADTPQADAQAADTPLTDTPLAGAPLADSQAAGTPLAGAQAAGTQATDTPLADAALRSVQAETVTPPAAPAPSAAPVPAEDGPQQPAGTWSTDMSVGMDPYPDRIPARDALSYPAGDALSYPAGDALSYPAGDALSYPAEDDSQALQVPPGFYDPTDAALADMTPASDTGGRAARRQRVPTREIFCELADLASIPRAAYALEAETDGAMCLLPTPDGFEVFIAADGARHELRSFAEEEAAYFYLFGILSAEAVRSGALAPTIAVANPHGGTA